MSSDKVDTEKSAADFYPGSSSPDPGHGDIIEDHGAESGLQRRLGTRHITMIALGSSIGMGLWLGSGTSLIAGGPAAMFIGCRLPCCDSSVVVLQTLLTGAFSLWDRSPRRLDDLGRSSVHR